LVTINHFHRLIDLYAPQVFVNDLLTNHTSELHFRLAHCNSEFSSLIQRIEAGKCSEQEVLDLIKSKNRFEKQENHLQNIHQHMLIYEEQILLFSLFTIKLSF
jgi:hypothetical protein